MTMQIEQWKNVCFEKFSDYQVSNSGKVRRVSTNRILKQEVSNCGHSLVTLYNKNVARQKAPVYKLVVLAFVDECSAKQLRVKHLDGNKQNNSLSNIRWTPPLRSMQVTRISDTAAPQVVDIGVSQSRCAYGR